MQFLRASLLVILLLNAACRVTEIDAQTDDSQVRDSIQATNTLPSYFEIKQETFPYRASSKRRFDLLHTKLEVKPNIQEHTLDGIATLQLRPYFYQQNHLILDAKGFDIHTLVLLVNNEEKPLEYTYDEYQLDITLDRTYSRDEDLFIRIHYTARPDEVALQGSEAITQDKGLYFIGTDSLQIMDKPIQVWTQGETQANSCWFPTIDAPNERTTQEMFITVYSTFQTLSNGTLVSSQFNDDHTRTDYWNMDQPHAPYLFMMAIGEYAIVEDQWKDKRVSYYVEPTYEPYARAIFGRTPEMMEYFSGLIGVEFPWAKYAQVVVRDFVSGAMENTTASVFMQDLQVDDRELLDYHWDGIIAHELFHQWFGDLVTCESWANLPLNESFATYSEYLWSNYKYGKDEGDYVLWEQGQNYFAEAEEKQVDLIRFHYQDQEDMFDRHSYDKGSRILHMLRTYLGDEAFFTALHHYLNKHAYTSVEIHDLRLAFEEVSGEDLNWFFNQWFLDAGHPKLQLTHSYDSGKLKVNIQQVQDLKEAQVFKIPVNMEVWVKGKSQMFPLLIDEAEKSWNFDLNQKPDLLLLDPNADLLMEVDQEKTAAEWAHQYRNASNAIRRIEALEALAQDSVSTEVAGIYKEALKDSFWAIRQTALNTLELFPQYLNAQDIMMVLQMAEQDKKSLVRADALTLLSTLDANQYQEVFLRGIQDSSYAVVGSAIAAYTLSNASDKTEVFLPYESYSNLNVVISLANYYVDNSIQNKYSWFIEKLKKINDEALYYLLNYFARYLIDLQGDQQEEGINLLAEYAKNHPKYYVRLNAYRSLGFFEDQGRVRALRQNIKKQETDKRLQSMYESIP
ncbi:M1 family metallopeptidase [Catalinimonas niigatensis]|uniref:M1 family metallopeptidase n=1 Tax=Catalinimonas niigatensis TaxID=1397264 RepID=UPI0026652AD9|nr:M1 family metallopeptidase [Catalinimonas niigatensis]WPP52531.1 M1 family metallopeptidase [Catalinimonas niigatensis]